MWLSVMEQVLDYGFLLVMSMYLFFFTASMLYLLAMHFLMPRSILEKYFTSPYFGDFERAFFTGIPFAPMRTIMFIGVITYPSLGKKRNLTEVHKEAPRWYRIGSRLFMYQFFFIGLGGIALLFLLVGITFILDTMGLI